MVNVARKEIRADSDRKIQATSNLNQQVQETKWVPPPVKRVIDQGAKLSNTLERAKRDLITKPVETVKKVAAKGKQIACGFSLFGKKLPGCFFFKRLESHIFSIKRLAKPWSHRSVVVFFRDANIRLAVNVSVTTAKDNVTQILFNPRLATLENKQLRVYHGGSSQDHLFVLQCKMIMHGKWTYNYESAKCLAPLVIPRMYTKFLNCLNSSRGLREAVERLFQKNLSTQEDFIAEYKAHKKDVTKSCYQELLAQANCVHTATTQAEAVNRCHGNTSPFSIIRPAARFRLRPGNAGWIP